MRPPPAVELRDLVKTFRSPGRPRVRAVDGVDLTIGSGEIVAFLGPNGAGKTTTLDMVLGLTRPTSGSARVIGLDPRAAVEAGRVSAVLQTGGLLGDISVIETVRLIASFFPAPATPESVLERAGIAELARRKVSKCSGGEQQRLRFALALLPDPDLLILDEPTAGLDVTARREFWDTMRSDATSGRTIVFATHYLEEADAFAERIVLIAGGRIVADGPTEVIRAAAGGRRVTATLPDDRGDGSAIDRLRSLPGVVAVDRLGRRVSIEVATTGSDEVARALLGDLGGVDVEIGADGLESAFLSLTTNQETTA